MKKYIFGFFALAGILPLGVSAHEQQKFEIGGEEYLFVVGSLNEPITVDDKTGVELRVSMTGDHESMSETEHHDAGGALTGLEETLAVELIAGDKKKVLSLSPVYNTPGAYKANFIPTVATTLSYRVFGTLHETPIDLTFTCAQAGHSVAEEDTNRIEISEGVTRISKTGSFGCPSPKDVLGFPEESKDTLSLLKEGEDGDSIAWIALFIGAIALGVAFRRKI